MSTGLPMIYHASSLLKIVSSSPNLHKRNELMPKLANSNVDSPSGEQCNLHDANSDNVTVNQTVAGVKHSLRRIPDPPAKRGKSRHAMNDSEETALVAPANPPQTSGVPSVDALSRNTANALLGSLNTDGLSPDMYFLTGIGLQNTDHLDFFHQGQAIDSSELTYQETWNSDAPFDGVCIGTPPLGPDYDMPNCVWIHNVHPADFLALSRLDGRSHIFRFCSLADDSRRPSASSGRFENCCFVSQR
jgi:hypothetical protein